MMRFFCASLVGPKLTKQDSVDKKESVLTLGKCSKTDKMWTGKKIPRLVVSDKCISK